MLLPLLAALMLNAGAGSPGSKSSTAEERQRVTSIAHKLEASPLDAALAPDAEWAKQWVVENPDVRIRVCTQLLAGMRTPKYEFRHELIQQMMLSSAAFLIEHPDKSGDHLAESVGGMEGLLKAYSSILKSRPDAHAKALDDLLVKQSQGKLNDWVRDTITVCHF
jgi:hypothetical protein